jgi:hypothetical protein
MIIRRNHLQSAPRPSTLVLLLALLPVCCAAPQPPPKPPEPAPEAQAPPPRQARPILRAAWSFQSTPDACVAVAKAGAASLQISVRREGPIRLTISLPGDTPASPVARFSGPAGRWLITGIHGGPHAAVFTLDRNETSLSRILVLLSGGTLTLEPAGGDLPILSLPESGADGQQWFGCVRGIVTWT